MSEWKIFDNEQIFRDQTNYTDMTWLHLFEKFVILCIYFRVSKVEWEVNNKREQCLYGATRQQAVVSCSWAIISVL